MIPKSVKLLLGVQKSKMWSKPLKNLGKVHQVCKLNLWLVVYSKPPKILPARGTRPNKNK